jgi:hypothetical protein
MWIKIKKEFLLTTFDHSTDTDLVYILNGGSGSDVLNRSNLLFKQTSKAAAHHPLEAMPENITVQKWKISFSKADDKTLN